MPHLPTHRPAATRRGFTLMEIMVALLIFGAMLAALASVIHTSTRAWRVGHAISEMTQTAHVARDVLLRDLENLYYLPETDYNKTFRRQLKMLAQQVDSATGTGGYDARGRRRKPSTSRRAQQRATDAVANAPEGEFGLADITPPIDLSFHASGSGEGGELSFARIQPARWEGDPDTLGIRRVKYYVKENVLYREERDPYGFNPGAAYQIDPDDENFGALLTLSSLFKTRAADATPPADATAGMIEDAKLAIPTQVSYAEPLCEGVAEFEMTMGYFRDGLWNEVDDWASGEVRYRSYLDPDEEAERPDIVAPQGSNIGILNQIASQSAARRVDNLPGYMRIRLGIQPGGKGRIQEYEIVYAFPQSQEDDVYDEERVAEHGGDLATALEFGNEQDREQRRESRRTAAERRERRDRERDAARAQRQGERSRRNSNSQGIVLGGRGTDTGWGWGTETGY